MEKPFKSCQCGGLMSAQVVNKQIDYPDVPVEGDGFIIRNTDGTPLLRHMTQKEMELWRQKIHLLRHLPKAKPGQVLYTCSCGRSETALELQQQTEEIEINESLIQGYTPRVIPEVSDSIRWNGIVPFPKIGQRPKLTQPQRQQIQNSLDRMYYRCELALDKYRHSIMDEVFA